LNANGPPRLPQGRFVELAEGGTLIVREVGKRDLPPIMLLHGWTATADLNWFTCYDPLAERYRVIAHDHRGHGTGLRTRERFSLEACADDAVAVAAAMGIDRFVVVGYSMGGAVAQLVWRRHPEVVRGLVLCATASRFTGRRVERLSFLGLTGLATVARFTPEQARIWVTEQMYLQRKSKQWEPWAVQEASSHDWRMILEAGKSIGAFSSLDWLGEIDVPTSVVITMRDDVVPLERQAELFEMIPGAVAFRVDGAHDSAVYNADRFVPTLIEAIESVESRA
jgi:pimeloyl-ACP methyl ester carboxylesterase